MVQHIGPAAPGDVCLVWTRWTSGHTGLVVTLDLRWHSTSGDPRRLVGTLSWWGLHTSPRLFLYVHTCFRTLVWGTQDKSSPSVCLTLQTYLSQGTPWKKKGHKNQPTHQNPEIHFLLLRFLYVTLPPLSLHSTSVKNKFYKSLLKFNMLLFFAQNHAYLLGQAHLLVRRIQNVP